MNLSSFLLWWRKRSAELKTDVITLGYAMQHRRTPWYARIFVAAVVAYAISPIDLIPDFIPVFGYLDDLILIPLGALIAVKMIPADVWAECRTKTHNTPLPRNLYWGGIFLVLCVWAVTAYFLWRWLV